jgi:hypothetical protein
MCDVLLPPGVNRMCAVLLPPGVNPITVKHVYHIYITSYISYHICRITYIYNHISYIIYRIYHIIYRIIYHIKNRIISYIISYIVSYIISYIVSYISYHISYHMRPAVDRNVVMLRIPVPCLLQHASLSFSAFYEVSNTAIRPSSVLKQSIWSAQFVFHMTLTTASHYFHIDH